MIESSIKEISLEGFKVVSGEMFAHLPRKTDATCTLWPTAMSFSKQALLLLGNCEHVRIEVNVQRKGLLVVPVTTKDRDCIHWIKSIKTPTIRKMECCNFTRQLYDAWGWNPDQIYRATGRLVTADNKVMLLFEFHEAETWKRPEAGGRGV